MTYALDGHCHNANSGTYGHECGKPAEWIGETSKGFRSGYCSRCKEHGDEARGVVAWWSIPLPDGWTWQRVVAERAKWDIGANMIPVAVASGACVAWATINSVRMQAEG